MRTTVMYRMDRFSFDQPRRLSVRCKSNHWLYHDDDDPRLDTASLIVLMVDERTFCLTSHV